MSDPLQQHRSRRALLRAALACGGAAVIASRASGAPAAPAEAPLTAQDRADLQRISVYLNAIRTMTATFQQNADRGGISTGHLWLSRPGRMRFEYDPPSPVLLIADGAYVIYYDKELQESQRVGLKSTPAWFLLRDPITFGEDLIVTGFERGQNAIRISVVERSEPDAGMLSMTFSERPLALRQWTVIDQQRRATTVTLSAEQFGMALAPTLFQYQDPFAASQQTIR